jgi:glutamine synthetase
MVSLLEPLAGVVTTDLAAITRGRFVAESKLEKIAATGVGWIQTNLSLTAFSVGAEPNIWGSGGDLRLIPDFNARYRCNATGSESPFDMIMGDLVEIDGSPWAACSRTILKNAQAALKAATGLSLKASFEQEFYLLGQETAPGHSLSFAALRQADPFAPRLMAALQEAGLSPEVILAEVGPGQIEVSTSPADPVAAADRAIAVREITRELARNCGRQASFSPKPFLDHVGNGVHIHFSLVDGAGRAMTYDAEGPANLSPQAAAFCAGILHHLPALVAFTASSAPSYYRLKPYSWSSSYTWLALQDREATLRVCPILKMSERDPADQLNIEFRAADATANPYLALAVLIYAGLEGLKNGYELPPLTATNPEELSPEQREFHRLSRLPASLEASLNALEADKTVTGWFAKSLVDCFLAVKRTELRKLEGLDQQAVSELYRTLY